MHWLDNKVFNYFKRSFHSKVNYLTMFSINTAYEGLYMWHGQNVYRLRTLLSIGRQKMTSKRMKEKSRQNIDSISRACIHVLKKIVKRDWGKSGRRTVVVRNTDIELLLCGILTLNCCCAEYWHWTVVVRNTGIELLLCGIPTLKRKTSSSLRR